MDEKKCPKCAMLIPKEAKVCPHCRKKFGMTWPLKIFLIIVALIIIGNLIDKKLKIPTQPISPTSSKTIKRKRTPTVTPSFNAISMVKSKIPSNMKKYVWYNEEWKQSKIDRKTWKVSVANGIWKVSKNRNLCSETGRLVSICSENGTAKSYSGLGYCKPSYICENKQLNVSNINIVEELGKIDLSKLSYSGEEKDGWKYTKVNGIPEMLRRAISYQALKYERKNQDAQIEDTCRALSKRYNLPYKAVEAIYLEGVVRKWDLGL